MAITVVRNSKESVDRLISRFNKKVQSSRVLLITKAKRYRTKPLKKRQIRAAAIMREKYRSQKDKLRFY